MSYLEVPRFPRGFVLSERPVDPPPSFVAGSLLPNFWVHPWTNVETAGNLDLFVVILGHAVPTRPEQKSDAASDLLTALRYGEGEFLRALDEYSGRYAIIFGSSGNMSVVNDATGMRSVFYAVDGGVIASHAALVERTLGGSMVRNDLPFRYGYPGNRTPFERTRILTPNTYYWITAHVVRRFWPIVPPATRTVDQAAAHLLEASTVALRSIAKGRTLGLTLTAGLDSRAVLSVALHAGVDFHTYTYRDDAASAVDRALARELATAFGIKHYPVERRIKEPGLDEAVNESHYSLHHDAWIGALRNHFQDPSSVAVIGNLLEIGRSNYAPARAKGALPPVDAETMVALHHRKLGDGVMRRVKEYGEEAFAHDSQEAFQEFINKTGWATTQGVLDPFDQFYWEHRMGTWQGVAMGERDFYAEPFIPFNARSVFETMLGVPAEYRRTDATVLRMIEMVEPQLLDLPVNPKRWPEKVTADS